MFPDLEHHTVSSGEKSSPNPCREHLPVLTKTAWWAARRVGFATIGALAFRGIGSFTVVGPIIAALNGGTVGSIASRLSGIGIPKTEAKRYEDKIKQGCILMSVHTENPEAIERAKEIFIETGAQDICATGESSLKDSSAVEYASRPTEAAYSHTRP